MEVLILNPPRYKGMNVRRDERSADICEGEVSPFYVGALLAEWLRKENNCWVRLLDANGLNVGYDYVNDWIAKYPNAEYIIIKAADDTLLHDTISASLAKQHGKKTVLWEPILSPAMPERLMELIPDLDYLILGEAELTASDLITRGNEAKGIAYRQGDTIKVNPRTEGERLIDLDRLPIPNFSELPVRNYRAWFGERPWMMLFSSRGCRGECSYCLVGGSTCFRGYGRKLRFFSPERIVDEMEVLVNKYKVRHISFWDDCFTSDRKRMLKICALIKERNIRVRWSCMSRTDTVDADILLEMKNSGLQRIGFGIESGCQRVLNSVPKHVTVEQNKNAIKTARSLGLWVWVFVLFGLPEDNEASLQDTINFIKETRPQEVLYGTLMPFPGTKMYEECRNKGLFRHDIFDLISKGNVPTGGQAFISTNYVGTAVQEKYLRKLSRTIKLHPAHIARSLSSQPVKTIRSAVEYLKKKII